MQWIIMTTTCLLLLHCKLMYAVEYNADHANKTESELVGCLKSSNTDEIRQLRLNLFKQELLLRLNLDKEPENPPPEVVQMYREQFNQKNEYEAVRASHQLQDKEIRPCVEVNKRISRLVVFFPDKVNEGKIISSSEAADESNTNNLVDTLRFTFAVDLVGHQEVTEAELRLYKIVVDDNTTVQEERIDIYIIYPDKENYYGEDVKSHVVAGNVKTDRDGYTIFNVKDAIKEWKEKVIDEGKPFQGELVLQVEIRTKDQEGFSSPPKVQYASDNTTTQLVVRTLLDKPRKDESNSYLPETVPKREKRSAGDPSQILNCGLQALVIDFIADFNWTWVIHPPTVVLNYCSGLCGRASAENLHTEYLSLRSTILSNPVGASEPCCIPNSYESATLSLAVPGPEKVKLEKVPELTITSCVCR